MRAERKFQMLDRFKEASVSRPMISTNFGFKNNLHRVRKVHWVDLFSVGQTNNRSVWGSDLVYSFHGWCYTLYERKHCDYAMLNKHAAGCFLNINHSWLWTKVKQNECKTVIVLKTLIRPPSVMVVTAQYWAVHHHLHLNQCFKFLFFVCTYSLT